MTRRADNSPNELEHVPKFADLRAGLRALGRALAAYSEWMEAFNREQRRKARIRRLYIDFDPATQPPALPEGEQ